MEPAGSFPASYEQAREIFLAQLPRIQRYWPATRLQTHPLKDFPDLSIDWMWAEPPRKEKVILLSTGEHGIEGYAGAAVMQLFIEEFVPRIRSEKTGLLLVHAINPWGMKHFRKVTSNNVDLNRNFVTGGSFDRSKNPDFTLLHNLLTPGQPVSSFAIENLHFWARAVQAMLRLGTGRVSTATLLGQHHTSRGFFYGGEAYEENTEVVISLFRRTLEEYESVTHIDIHTGYGPHDRMSIIIPPADPISSAEASRKFTYPVVQKITAEEFYAIDGDMQEYYYRLRDGEYASKGLFACGFEFGTLGDSLLARIRSLRAMVFENQVHWHGARNDAAARKVRREFENLYIPSRKEWRTRVLDDARQGLDGILKAAGVLKDQ
jgi:hypothetical protein